MTRRLVRIGRCYRCLHVWRMRRRRPMVCPSCKSRLYDVPVVRPVVLGSGQGIAEIIVPHRVKILELARASGVEGIWVFGSVRRSAARRDSDVDLLVTWNRSASLLALARLVDQLSGELGRSVSVVDRESLHWSIAPQVLADAVPV
jgi:predicted nucleotidyltransferase